MCVEISQMNETVCGKLNFFGAGQSVEEVPPNKCDALFEQIAVQLLLSYAAWPLKVTYAQANKHPGKHAAFCLSMLFHSSRARFYFSRYWYLYL